MAAMAADADAPVCVPIMLALHLGLRREEILGLRFRDIDFSAKTLHVQNTRTKVYEIVEEENTKSSASNRILYLDDELVSFLKKIQKSRPSTSWTWETLIWTRSVMCIMQHML